MLLCVCSMAHGQYYNLEDDSGGCEPIASYAYSNQQFDYYSISNEYMSYGGKAEAEICEGSGFVNVLSEVYVYDFGTSTESKLTFQVSMYSLDCDGHSSDLDNGSTGMNGIDFLSHFTSVYATKLDSSYCAGDTEIDWDAQLDSAVM